MREQRTLPGRDPWYRQERRERKAYALYRRTEVRHTKSFSLRLERKGPGMTTGHSKLLV